MFGAGANFPGTGFVNTHILLWLPLLSRGLQLCRKCFLRSRWDINSQIRFYIVRKVSWLLLKYYNDLYIFPRFALGEQGPPSCRLLAKFLLRSYCPSLGFGWGCPLFGSKGLWRGCPRLCWNKLEYQISFNLV